jgi:SAM-dependent methyltransferase
MANSNEASPYDDWADIYDKVYAYLDYDLSMYVEQATKSGGPILELGCGTGRVSLALASASFDVTGVDISPRMIERAIEKADQRGLSGKTRFIAEDMLDVQIGEPDQPPTGDDSANQANGEFGMVCFPFRSFQSMLTVEEQREALENAAAHLRPDGLLVLDLFAPEMDQLGNAHDEAVPFHVRDVDQDDGGTIVVWGQNLWDPMSQVNSARLIIEGLDPTGLMLYRIYRDFDLRYTFRYEMEHLLELSGFDVEAVYGDFDGGEVTEQSDDIIFIARKAS